MHAFALDGACAQQILTSILFSAAGGNPHGLPFIRPKGVGAARAFYG